jgi:cyclohexyl-isocyanide hydratase
MNPTMTFADVPDDLDVLFVPGGFGTVDMMEDQEVLDFLARVGATARYVTSVCTGSAILAMAGLLDGYRAATYWAFYEPLEALGIEPSYDRVAIDRNRITGGGVTAGIDFALTVIAELKGQDAAEFVQLALEYDPHPPFNAGHPRSARQEIIDMVSGPDGMMREMTPAAVAVAKAHKERLTNATPQLAPV